METRTVKQTKQTVPVYRWTRVTEQAPFAARDGAGALVFQNRMWLLGGWNPSDPVHFPKICNSEVWSSADGAHWTLENPHAPWEGRHCAGYVVHQGKMRIVGGDPNQGYHQSDVWSSADGVKWELVTSEVPWGPRGMIGGSVVFKNRMWLLGGGTYDTPKKPDRIYYNDVWSSADGIHWQQHVKAAPWRPRQYHDVAVFDDRMWIMEGYSPGIGNSNDVWHSADGVEWTELPGTPWLPRHAASVFVHDHALWMVAGNNMTPDVWKLPRVK